MSDDERVSNEADSPLSDESLLDLLDALVESRGRVAAAEALGVNYRTMMACYDSRRVSRRMRKALRGFQDAGGDGGTEASESDGVVEDDRSVLLKRAAELEEENRELRELVEAQGRRIVELEGGGEGSEEERQRVEADASEADDVQRVPVETGDAHAEQPTEMTGGVEGPGEGAGQPGEADAVGDGDDGIRRWLPPRRDHGLPDAGVVTLEGQPDEEHAFGPAAQLVAEWRGLRTGGEVEGGRVDRAWAAARRWELEIAMLKDYGLTLPPQTESLDASRREDHLRWGFAPKVRLLSHFWNSH